MNFKYVKFKNNNSEKVKPYGLPCDGGDQIWTFFFSMNMWKNEELMNTAASLKCNTTFNNKMVGL